MGALAALVLAGILVQGCSDNNSRITNTGSKVTADAVGGPLGSLFVTVTVNSAGERASVLVVVTNANGIALSGKTVLLSATGGKLDATSGTTGANGLFSTTMLVPCGVTGTVTAIVEGVTSSAAFTGAVCAP